MPVDVTRLHGLLRPDQVDTNAPLTLRATKEAFRRLHQDVDPSDADLIAACYASADFREGVRAFQAKRAPNWTGA